MISRGDTAARRFFLPQRNEEAKRDFKSEKFGPDFQFDFVAPN